MNSHNSFGGCLSIIATLISILTGLIAIFEYFFGGREVFFTLLSEWVAKISPYSSQLIEDFGRRVETAPIELIVTIGIISIFVAIVGRILGNETAMDLAGDNPLLAPFRLLSMGVTLFLLFIPFFICVALGYFFVSGFLDFFLDIVY